jgi:hypothetical protein
LAAVSILAAAILTPTYGLPAGALIVAFALVCIVIAASALMGAAISIRADTIYVRSPFRLRKNFPISSVDRLVCVRVQGTGYISLVGVDGGILATLGDSFEPDALEAFSARTGLPVSFTQQSMLEHMVSGGSRPGARARYSREQTLHDSTHPIRRGWNSLSFAVLLVATIVFLAAAILGHR